MTQLQDREESQKKILRMIISMILKKESKRLTFACSLNRSRPFIIPAVKSPDNPSVKAIKEEKKIIPASEGSLKKLAMLCEKIKNEIMQIIE